MHNWHIAADNKTTAVKECLKKNATLPYSKLLFLFMRLKFLFQQTIISNYYTKKNY